jgi:hypothetical protein
MLGVFQTVLADCQAVATRDFVAFSTDFKPIPGLKTVEHAAKLACTFWDASSKLVEYGSRLCPRQPDESGLNDATFAPGCFAVVQQSESVPCIPGGSC